MANRPSADGVTTSFFFILLVAVCRVCYMAGTGELFDTCRKARQDKKDG